MKLLRIVIPYVLGSLLLGCEQDITFDIEREPPQLAIHAIMYPDSLISVWVTQTKFVLDKTPIRAVSNATVSITPEGQLPQQLVLQDAQRGQYRADFAPELGTTYYLKVAAEGLPVAEATTLVPMPVPIQTVDYTILRTNQIPWCAGLFNCDSAITQYQIALTFEDPADENYYEVVSYVQYSTERSAYDPVKNESYIEVDTSLYLPDQLSNDPAVDPFGEASVASQRYGSSQELRFSDQLFKNRAYTFKYSINNTQIGANRLIIVFRTYHADAYRYLRAKEAQQGNVGGFIYEPVQIPQNIQGGYGIFSSYSEDTVVIELP